MILWKWGSDSRYNSVAYYQVKTTLSESEAEAERPDQYYKVLNMQLYWFILLLLLLTLTIWFSLDCKWQSHKRSQKKMEMLGFIRLSFHRAHDCAYNSNFDFHKVISALTTRVLLWFRLWLCRQWKPALKLWASIIIIFVTAQFC